MLTANEHNSYARNFRLQLTANEYNLGPSTQCVFVSDCRQTTHRSWYRRSTADCVGSYRRTGYPRWSRCHCCRYLLPWVRLYQRSANGAEVNPSDGSEVRHGCQNHKRASPKKQDPGIQGHRFPKAQGSPGTLPKDFS